MAGLVKPLAKQPKRLGRKRKTSLKRPNRISNQPNHLPFPVIFFRLRTQNFESGTQILGL